jgi:16S rRNA (cytosine967-C5)-methyltransferase
MRDGGRLAAAVEVLEDVEGRHRPVRLALKDWGAKSRFAGAKDRAWVAGLVLDILRRRRSLGWKMGEDSLRAAALGALRFSWDWPVDRIASAAAEEPHGIGAVTEAEAAALAAPRDLGDAPAPVRGDYPDWLTEDIARAYGEAGEVQMAALAERAPVDVRVNTLKAEVDRVLKALEPLNAAPVGYPPTALRIAAPRASERTPALEAAPAFVRGWFEVQDLGSQIAAAAAGEVKGKQVLDLCAGGGGKTLALAAAMGKSGQIYAYDSDARRLADTVRRADRADVRNLQIRSPIKPDVLKDLEGRIDVVFVDAPCSGSGSWRRHPDTKWRLSAETLARRHADQDAVLDQAVAYVKPGGRIVYVTCSVLPSEDEDRVAAFLQRHPAFVVRPAGEALELAPWRTPQGFLRLSPWTSATDGFFVAVLERPR